MDQTLKIEPHMSINYLHRELSENYLKNQQLDKSSIQGVSQKTKVKFLLDKLEKSKHCVSVVRQK